MIRARLAACPMVKCTLLPPRRIRCRQQRPRRVPTGVTKLIPRAARLSHMLSEDCREEAHLTTLFLASSPLVEIWAVPPI